MASQSELFNMYDDLFFHYINSTLALVEFKTLDDYINNHTTVNELIVAEKGKIRNFFDNQLYRGDRIQFLIRDLSLELPEDYPTLTHEFPEPAPKWFELHQEGKSIYAFVDLSETSTAPRETIRYAINALEGDCVDVIISSLHGEEKKYAEIYNMAKHNKPLRFSKIK